MPMDVNLLLTPFYRAFNSGNVNPAVNPKDFRAMRKLTDKGVAALKPRPARYTLPDPQQLGGYIRVQPSGSKSYWAMTRDPTGKQIGTLIGVLDVLDIAEARVKAAAAIKRVRAGLPAFEPPPVVPESFKAVAEGWLKRYVAAKALLSETEVRR